jgi:hypothetical protein
MKVLGVDQVVGNKCEGLSSIPSTKKEKKKTLIEFRSLVYFPDAYISTMSPLLNRKEDPCNIR